MCCRADRGRSCEKQVGTVRASLTLQARVSVHAADVKSILRQSSIDLHASQPDDLKQADIVMRLQKSGGASCACRSYLAMLTPPDGPGK